MSRKRMIRIGLTGSIGMGKSTTAQMFRDEGIAVLDSDQVVHDIYRGPDVDRIEALFPGVVKEGAVDRVRLAACVLADPAAMQRLEAIVHPLVWAARDEFVTAREAAGDWAVIYDIPLLFETGADRDVDVIVVVTAPEDVQKRRVLERPGMTEEKFRAILAKQVPDSEKRARADFLVHTDRGLEAAREEVRAVLQNIKTRDMTATEPSTLQKMRNGEYPAIFRPVEVVEDIRDTLSLFRWIRSVGRSIFATFRWIVSFFT